MECDWVEDFDGVWNTACDHAFVFDSGNPQENDFAFCPYCGGKLIQHDVPEEDDDE